MVEDIRIRRLGLAGHSPRTEEEKIAKKFLNGKFHNKRPAGKPKTSWKEVVRRDTSRVLGIRGRWRRSDDGEKWRRRLREARAQKGL
jgi:hypothetical protein